MHQNEVIKLAKALAREEGDGLFDLKTTHISWVILTGDYAYKIKRPVKFSFLDFSTPEQREYYCHREITLNRRFSDGVYLDVIPIYTGDGGPYPGDPNGPPIDYAIKMRRLDSDRQMDLLLERGQVTEMHIDQLANQLSTFHVHTDVIEAPISVQMFLDQFTDIQLEYDFIEQALGSVYSATIARAIAFATSFLHEHEERLLARHDSGFTVDGHGDLHSGNIFLLESPVIFDCIEFSDAIRQIDVINELAFLCMDLEFHGHHELAQYFMHQYLVQYPCIETEEDELIFIYYKLYRTNVKIKVNALKAMHTEEKDQAEKYIGLIQDYLWLMHRYLDILKASSTS